ncbi:TPA: plasmid recombination protein, partial [Klebsiella oxytoca]|nr:plasmid recombination protein [Klebsiella oxytoca]
KTRSGGSGAVEQGHASQGRGHHQGGGGKVAGRAEGTAAPEAGRAAAKQAQQGARPGPLVRRAHMTAFVVPLTQDGRLSAKEFIGNKAQMTRDQTTFAAAVADLGLQRGIEGSKARHTRIQAFYEALERPPVGHATIEASAVQPKVLRKGIFSKDVETPDAVAERLTKAVRKGYEPAVIAAAGAREMAQKAKQAQETARDLRDRL